MISYQYASRITLRRDKVEPFEQYPFSLPVVRHLEQIDLHPGVSFFVGENGSGKSTLREAIAVSPGFNAEGGSKNFSFRTRQSHSDLHGYLRIAKGLRRPRDASEMSGTWSQRAGVGMDWEPWMSVRLKRESRVG